jgi:hypothetical protein
VRSKPRGKETEVQTQAGTRRPSRETGYARDRRGRSVDKAYGDQGYRKGMKKRPRRNLTLGNMVMRKGRKRVEGIEGKNPNVVGGQRVRQRQRGSWDERNLERRKVQAGYRTSILSYGTRGTNQEKSVGAWGEARQRYVEIRTCERARNRYELRERYETHARGGKRNAWARKGKYTLPVLERGEEAKREARREEKRRGLGATKRGKRDKKKKPRTPSSKTARGRRTGGREERKEKEVEGLKTRHKARRVQARNQCEASVKGRKARRARVPSRKKVEHLETLRKRAEATRKTPRQVKNREGGVPMPYGKPERNGDRGREILFAAPTTEYFAKRKNLVRRKERAERGEMDAEKWRKVPEKARRERRPTWTELDRWMNRRSQGIEDRNRERLLEGKPVSLSTATYVELGKTVVYLYGCERSERWKEKTGAKRKGGKPALEIEEGGRPSNGSRHPTG